MLVELQAIAVFAKRFGEPRQWPLWTGRELKSDSPPSKILILSRYCYQRRKLVARTHICDHWLNQDFSTNTMYTKKNDNGARIFFHPLNNTDLVFNYFYGCHLLEHCSSNKLPREYRNTYKPRFTQLGNGKLEKGSFLLSNFLWVIRVINEDQSDQELLN